jgi:hypothetical protein
MSRNAQVPRIISNGEPRAILFSEQTHRTPSKQGYYSHFSREVREYIPCFEIKSNRNDKVVIENI